MKRIRFAELYFLKIIKRSTSLHKKEEQYTQTDGGTFLFHLTSLSTKSAVLRFKRPVHTTISIRINKCSDWSKEV